MANEIVNRPWGHYTVIGSWSDKIMVRILTVKPSSRLSLQKHRQRDEEWLCLKGRAEVQVDDRKLTLAAGEKVSIPRGHLHRLGSEKGTEVLEVAFGKFRDDDIVRVEDDYGRAGSS